MSTSILLRLSLLGIVILSGIIYYLAAEQRNEGAATLDSPIRESNGHGGSDRGTAPKQGQDESLAREVELEAFPEPKRFTAKRRSDEQQREERPSPLGPAELRALHPILAKRIQKGFVEENRQIFQPCFEALRKSLQEAGGLDESDVRTIDFDLGLTIATDNEVGRVEESEYLSFPAELQEEHQRCFTAKLAEMTFDASDIDFSGRIRYPIRAVVRGQ